jgi:iron complex transport system substrate-binding protein
MLMTGLFIATVTRAEEPRRIVTLGGAVTETVWALGAGDAVVAVDDSSAYFTPASDRPTVGYYRMISAEGVLSLRPDLVLASGESGPPEAVDHLRRAGIRFVTVTAAPSVDGCLERITTLAEALGRPEQGHALRASLLSALDSLPPAPVPAPRVVFIFARGAGTLNISGTGTAADAIIRLAGGVNAVDAYTGYRPMTAEAVVTANPDVIVMTTSGLAGIGGETALWQQPGLTATAAGRDRRIVALDDLLLLGFGPRLPEAMKSLREALTP